ncbi:MAG: GNAT family N-acetyltransferase [Alicyclobacillus sp.]|nr:GNAT family N-acetyltransferase [Alicyclobacillus sp.]
MNRRGARTAVIWFTALANAVALAVLAWTLAHHTGDPRWNQVLITYGIVFWLFLGFDHVGRSLVVHSNAKRATVVPRPRPAGDALPLPGPVPARPETSRPTVQLQRLQVADAAGLQRWLDAWAAEVWALEDVAWPTDAAGHAVDYQAADWLAWPGMHVFAILADSLRDVGEGDVIQSRRDAEVGFVAAVQRDGCLELMAVYVNPAVRRTGVGTAALAAFGQFAGLLVGHVSVTAYVSRRNWRAAQFLREVGFRPAAEGRLDGGVRLQDGQVAATLAGLPETSAGLKPVGVDGQWLVWEEPTRR